METELKGCLDCKHMQKSGYTLMCRHPDIVDKYTEFDHRTGKFESIILRKNAWDVRCDFGAKCKREAIYFEPTRYYRIKQWFKQLLK